MCQVQSQVLERRPCLVVRGKPCLHEMGAWLGRSFQSIEEHARRVGVTLAGPPFARRRPIDSELMEFEVEAGFAVSRPAALADGVEEAALELYHTGPRNQPDPARWRTEVVQPCQS